MSHVVCAYGEVGHAALAELLDLGADVGLVVTHRDDPGERIWFSSVAELAAGAGIATITPDDVNADEAVAAIAAVRPDFLFSFYFRQMMKPRVLALPSRAALNLHGSLLPRYRGRAPVNWALVNGESETGVTLHEMDEKPDHGAIVAQRRVAITHDDTALSLTRKLAAAGRELLRETHPLLVAGAAPRVSQDHSKSSYFGGRKPADGLIDWTRPAEAIRNLVRAVTDPWPGAFTFVNGRKVLVWAAATRRVTAAATPGTVLDGSGEALLVATGEGVLELLDVSFAGGERTSGAAWAAHAAVGTGSRFAATAVQGGNPSEGR